MRDDEDDKFIGKDGDEWRECQTCNGTGNDLTFKPLTAYQWVPDCKSCCGMGGYWQKKEVK